MNTQDQNEQPNPPPLRRPRRPPPDDVDRYMILTAEQREAYDAWRYVRAIQHYWHRREQDLRPPTLVLIGRGVFAVRRWWLRFVEEVRRQ